jgi:hypothetical protein
MRHLAFLPLGTARGTGAFVPWYQHFRATSAASPARGRRAAAMLWRQCLARPPFRTNGSHNFNMRIRNARPSLVDTRAFRAEDV